MTSATGRVYCFTCKKEIHPSWWTRHMTSVGHVRRALGDPPPFVQPKTGQPADDEPNEPTSKPPGPCVVHDCENRRMGGTGDGRMHCPDHQHYARPALPGRPTDRAEALEPAPTAIDAQDAPERPLARLARERREARGDHA